MTETREIFVFLVVLAVVLASSIIVLFSIFYRRKNKLINLNLQQKLLDQQKMHALELNALRSQLNPHFVHNSLNAILYYIQRNDNEMSEMYLGKFSKLMRQFFNFSNLKSIPISHELDLIENYLSIEKIRFEEKLEYTIGFQEDLNVKEVYIPTLLIQPIVENSIKHGIFPKNENGEITISFYKNEQYDLVIKIGDNGIGINKSVQKKQLYNNADRKSSVVLRDRIELLNKSGDWNIDYKIIDKSDLDINKTGTEIILYFKDL